jgi:hypothetical protein
MIGSIRMLKLVRFEVIQSKYVYNHIDQYDFFGIY